MQQENFAVVLVNDSKLPSDEKTTMCMNTKKQLQLLSLLDETHDI